MTNLTPDDRHMFGAGRTIRVVVNNPTRHRHGQTGKTDQYPEKSRFSPSGWSVWVFWDDPSEFPSYADLADLRQITD